MDHNSAVTGECRHCKKSTEWKLGRTISISGVNQVYWVCQICNKRAEKARNIPHDELRKRNIDIDKIKTVADYRGYEICARCGEIEAEYHHWAPRHLFADADAWPGDYLCRECHMKWHETVTPNMCEKKYD